jgi:ribonucleotide monophosphatase NagD (HAD superfamily)
MITIFCDLDGCLIEHQYSYHDDMVLLPGTVEKIVEWNRAGYNLIITTGRRESAREITAKKLSAVGIVYDQLVMGIGGHTRVLINDLKPPHPKLPTARAINLVRNEGIGRLEL